MDGASRVWDLPVFERGLAPSPSMVRNGKNVYLNLSPLGYLLQRARHEGRAWTAGLASLLKEAGVTPRLSISEPETESIFWKNPDRMTLCILKNKDRKASIDGFGSAQGALGDGRIKLKLSFAKPVQDLRNERTGKALGDGAEFEDEFTPWEANVYSYAP